MNSLSVVKVPKRQQRTKEGSKRKVIDLRSHAQFKFFISLFNNYSDKTAVPRSMMGIAPSFVEAFEKAEIAAGVSIPLKGSAFLSVRNTDKTYLEELAKSLTNSGFKLVATRGTARDLENMGFKVKKINKVLEGRPHIVDLMKNKEISLVVNTTEGRESITDSASIRRTALDQKICSSTTIEGARAICKVIENQVDWRVKKLQDIH